MLEGVVRRPLNEFDFITQTLNPWCNKFPSHKQFKMTLDYLLALLRYVAQDYCVVAEITQKGNVHYHMWIEYAEDKGYVDYVDSIKYNSMFGMTCKTELKYKKDKNEQSENVYKYMIKDIAKSYRYIRSLKMVMNPSDNEDTPDIDIDTSMLDNFDN